MSSARPAAEMRKFLIVFFVLALVAPAFAMQNASGFAQAEANFDGLDPNAKAFLQVLMTASGYWWQVPRLDYSPRLFEGTEHFQNDLGDVPTGVLTKAEVERLFAVGLANLRYWGFIQMAHPARGRPIWVPARIGGRIVRHGDDISFEGNGIEIRYKYLVNAPLEASYSFMLNKLSSEGQSILYQVMRKGFFAIYSEKDGISEYLRYHQDGAGLLGFSMFWRNNDAPLYGNRISVLVSASLSNQMLGTPMPPVPRFDDGAPRIARNDNQPQAAQQDGRSVAAAPSPAPQSQVNWSSGSGFFVDGAGHVLTNNHVVKDCTSSIHVFMDQAQSAEAGVIARDAMNDLALLSTGLKPSKTAGLRSSVRQGEAVAAFGYPHADVLASSGNFTLGNVTALAGLADDSRYLQISAPVQAGNSGGPLLDQYGNLVGIVSSKLNAVEILKESGDLPQNVNFAIHASLAASFLDENHIGYAHVDYAHGAPTNALKPEDLADDARAMSVFILCKGAGNIAGK